jgi:iron complex outermembrane receptor protein
MRLDVDATTLEGNWDLGWFTVTSVTGWRDTTEDLTFDVDGSEAFVYHTQRPAWYKQFSQELRAAGSLVDDRLRYVAGVYYFWGEYESDAEIQIPLSGAIGPDTALQRGKQTDVAPAAFANLDVQLIDTVKLSLGGRYTSEWKKFSGCAGTRAAGFTVCNGRLAGNVESASDSHTWRKFTPKIGLDWQPNDDLLFWISWSTGFRSGGYNGRNYGLTSIGPYDPEVLASWDAGMKSYWLDRRLRFNVGLFDNDYRNKMETVITADPVLGTQTQIVNAASASLRGYELELSAVPIDGLEIGGSWAQLDAKYDSFWADLDGDGIETDNSDRDVSQAPRYQIAAWTQYTLPWAIGPGQLTLGAQYRFRDASQSAVSEDDRADTPSFPILDASARYDFELEHGSYYATFFYRNLFDEVHALGGVTVTPLFSFSAVNPGRTWGLEVGFDF